VVGDGRWAWAPNFVRPYWYVRRSTLTHDCWYSNRFGQAQSHCPTTATHGYIVVAAHGGNKPRNNLQSMPRAPLKLQRPADREIHHCYTQPSSWGFPDDVSNTSSFKIDHILKCRQDNVGTLGTPPPPS
jgi:hypothetical protein